MNPVNIMLLMVVASALVAAPSAFLWDQEGAYFNDLMRLSNHDFIWISWGCSVYAFVAMALFYWIGRVGPLQAEYAARPGAVASRRVLWRFWLLTYVVAAACLTVAVVQTGGQIPLLQVSSHLQTHDVHAIRHETGEAINRNLFNVGLLMAMPLNLLLASSFLRSAWLIGLSVLMYLALGTFTLEKGPLALSLFSILFFWMLWRPMTLRRSWRLAIYGGVVLGIAGSMFFVTRFATDTGQIAVALYSRLVYGTISDLPYYFELFTDQPIGFGTILPPYIQPLFALERGEPTAARLVMEYSRPWAVQAGYAGVANSFYIGEAFAVGGYPFVFIAPVLVMANVLAVVRFFRTLEKTVLTTYAQSLLLFLLFNDLFAGIGPYVISRNQILFALFIAARLLIGWGFARRPAAHREAPGEREWAGSRA